MFLEIISLLTFPLQNVIVYHYLECDDGGWKEHRDQIENILIKKSIKYAQAVIAEFEKSAGKPIEEIIHENVGKHGLNHDLADAYASMGILSSLLLFCTCAKFSNFYLFLHS